MVNFDKHLNSEFKRKKKMTERTTAQIFKQQKLRHAPTLTEFL